MHAELRRLEDLQCIVREPVQPMFVLPLSRVFSNKWRLLLDAFRGQNPYCRRRGIKLDHLNHIKNILKQDNWMTANYLNF